MGKISEQIIKRLKIKMVSLIRDKKVQQEGDIQNDNTSKSNYRKYKFDFLQ